MAKQGGTLAGIMWSQDCWGHNNGFLSEAGLPGIRMRNPGDIVACSRSVLTLETQNAAVCLRQKSSVKVWVSTDTRQTGVTDCFYLRAH